MFAPAEDRNSAGAVSFAHARLHNKPTSSKNINTAAHWPPAPGHSNHNFGIAWDVGVFNEKGDYIDDFIDKKMMTSKAVDTEYKKVGAYGKALGLFWGGDWSDPDYSHFQMRDNNELASIRDAFTAGEAIV